MKRKMEQLAAMAMGTLAIRGCFVDTGEVSGGAGFEFLDGTLDDIADLPQFLAFPSGAYVVHLPGGMIAKKVGEHPALTMKVVCKEIKELSNPEDTALVKVGDQGDIAFMMDNETGRGFSKIVTKAIGLKLGTTNMREILAASKGIDALLVVKKTKDDKKQREYMNLVQFVPL